MFFVTLKRMIGASWSCSSISTFYNRTRNEFDRCDNISLLHAILTNFLINLTTENKIPLTKQLLSSDTSPDELVFSSADALNVHSPFDSLVIPLQVDSTFKINNWFTNVKH